MKLRFWCRDRCSFCGAKGHGWKDCPHSQRHIKSDNELDRRQRRGRLR